MGKENSNRRGFIKGVLATSAAAAVVKAEPITNSSNATAPVTASTSGPNSSFSANAKTPQNLSLEQIKSVAQPKNTAFQGPLITSSGETPFDRDKAAFDIATANLQRNFRISEGGGGVGINALGSPLRSDFLAIDYGFTFTAEPTDAEFRYQHCETLLDQAADLLDRGQRDRRDWDELAVKKFGVATELTEYYAIDVIHQKEIEKGFYTVESKLSHATASAERYNMLGSNMSANYLEWLLKNQFSDTEMRRQADTAQLAAFLSHLAAYELPAQGGLVRHAWGGNTKTIPEHLLDATFAQVWHSLLNQQVSLLSQHQSYQTTVDSATRRTEGLQAKADWDRSDIEFRRGRTKVARDIADLKMKAYTEPRGALNYDERMKPLKARFTRDFRDALARLRAASEGLSSLYGYDRSLPSSIMNTLGGTSSSEYQLIDDSENWTRDAISWLLRFTQLDQNYILPISIRRTINNDTQWKAGLAQGSWRIRLPEELFPDQRHIRLRGIGATVEVDSGEADELWQVVVKPPATAVSRHLSGQNRTLQQNQVPPIRLARVTARNSNRDTDVVGVVSLHNVSPLGFGPQPEWTISMAQTSLQGVQLKKVKDLVLDLHLAVRSV